MIFKFGEKDYWIKRYEEQKEKNYEWIENYDSLKPIIDNLNIDKNCKILNIGCGNSKFSEELYDNGYINNFNIDYCENVIEFMKLRNVNIRKNIVFEVMNAEKTSYINDYFDCVFDKGTFDSILSCKNSLTHIAKLTYEISRILKIGGIYFLISTGRPENRLDFLNNPHLSFNIKYICISKIENGREIIHYIYICTKNQNANEKLKNFDFFIKELEEDESDIEYYEPKKFLKINY
jgi:SAM-dependent methyltransferase